MNNKVIKFGDNIDTDQIVASQHLSLPSIAAMKQYTFEHHANFTENYSQGDFVVADENFGCGSSREQAPAVLKELGVGAIIAKSFARIFFRNSINLGILLIECPESDKIDNLDEISVDLDNGKISNLTKNEEYIIVPMIGFLKEVLDAGGIVPYKKAKMDK
jgi:3-isopropylmalate/(R)-2-methylmalate dehydratase small subunit